MSSIHIENLFPTPFMRVEKFLEKSDTDTIAQLVKFEQKQTNANSSRLTHTEPLHPDASAQYQVIAEKAGPLLRDFGFLLFGENLQWLVKEMWVNVMKTGGHQSMHSHANSFISGVIFLTSCDASAKTVFHKAMGMPGFVFSNSHKDSTNTPYNSDRWIPAEIRQGDLILFPSYMLHAVPKNTGKERISIAFNAIPKRLKSWDYEIEFAD